MQINTLAIKAHTDLGVELVELVYFNQRRWTAHRPTLISETGEKWGVSQTDSVSNNIPITGVGQVQARAFLKSLRFRYIYILRQTESVKLEYGKAGIKQKL